MKKTLIGMICGAAVVCLAGALFVVNGHFGAARSSKPQADASSSAGSVEVSQGSRFCPQSDDVDRRVCLIKAAADGASQTLILSKNPGLDASAVWSYLATLELLSFVQHEVSSARYSAWAIQEGFTPPKNAHAALVDAHGICGNHVKIFLMFAERLGLKARPVEFWYSDAKGARASHIGVEIFLLNRWVFADVSWGGLFLRDDAGLFSAMTLDEARVNPVRPRVNANDVWFATVVASGVDPFYYLTAPDLQVTRGHVGAIALYWQPVEAKGRKAWSTDFAHIPNYVGDNKPDGRQAGLEIVTSLPAGAYDLSFKISGVGGCKSSKLSVGGEKLEIKKPGDYVLRVTDPAKIEISGKDDVCYVVFSKITAAST